MMFSENDRLLSRFTPRFFALWVCDTVELSIVMERCEDMNEPSDLVYREKRRETRTEPWGTPVVREHGADPDPLY